MTKLAHGIRMALVAAVIMSGLPAAMVRGSSTASQSTNENRDENMYGAMWRQKHLLVTDPEN
jgi:hypothetical protein